MLRNFSREKIRQLKIFKQKIFNFPKKKTEEKKRFPKKKQINDSLTNKIVQSASL